MADTTQYLWKDRKRTLFGLPLSLTTYALSAEKLYTNKGLFTTRYDEMRLYRVLDITVSRTLSEKAFGLGTLHLCTADKSTPELDLKHIKHPLKVREILSAAVEEQRRNRGIVGREFLGNDGEEMHEDGMGHEA